MSGEPDSGRHASPWVRRARRVAYSNPWITVYHDAVDRPDGSPGIYGVVHFPGRAIGVVPIDDDGRVVLVRRVYNQVGGPNRVGGGMHQSCGSGVEHPGHRQQV